jgi:hypothetical protein
MEQRDMGFVPACEPGLENTRYVIGRGIVPKRTGRGTQHQNTVPVHDSSNARNSRFRLWAKAFLSSVLSSRPLLTS